MTHDMVHRTHLKIFETYYPAVFHNWFVDDWISTYAYIETHTSQCIAWIENWEHQLGSGVCMTPLDMIAHMPASQWLVMISSRRKSKSRFAKTRTQEISARDLQRRTCVREQSRLFSCVWHDSFICITWLIHVWRDSFMWMIWLLPRAEA